MSNLESHTSQTSGLPFFQLDISQWFIEPSSLFINKGEITEAFVGQEILAYSNPIIKEKLFYWHRESRNSQAEVDYLIQIKEKVIPIGLCLIKKSLYLK